MIYTIIFLLILVGVFIFYFLNNSNQINIPIPQISTEEQIVFVEKMKRLKQRIIIVFSILVGIVLLTPSVYLAYETIFTYENLPQDRYDARLKDVYYIAAFGIIMTILFHLAFKVIFNRMTNGMYNIILGLNSEDFNRVKELHPTYNIFDRMIHPMIVDQQILYVFKFGRIIQIPILDISYLNYKRKIKGKHASTDKNRK